MSQEEVYKANAAITRSIMAVGAMRRPAISQQPSDSRSTTRELEILNAVAQALNSAADVSQALSRTLALVTDLFSLRTGWVWLLNPETQQFYLAAAQNLPPFLQEPVRMSGHWCLCTDLFSKGRLEPSNVGVLSCSRLLEALKARVRQSTLGLRYHASIPLYFQDRPLGIINLTGPDERELGEDELRLLATISFQVGIAVERARLAEESTQLARVAERERIAREIHDTLAQGLTAIGLDIEGALRHIDAEPEGARTRLERALRTTRESLEEARRSVLDLRAELPGGRSLPDALMALGRDFTSDTGVPVKVDLHAAKPAASAPYTGQTTVIESLMPEGSVPSTEQRVEIALSSRVEAELFKVVQESLINIRKHARATQVEVRLQRSADGTTLSVQDNGVGFMPGTNDDGTHGLLGMRERVKLLGGRFSVRSRPGRGTRITVTIPAADAEQP
jgi:two-component system NarL family sensor kinase